MIKIKFKKLYEGAIVPSFAYANDAGLDLHSYVDICIPKGETKRVNTGIAMEMPKGYVGLIWDKSGLSIINGLKVMGGVIDSGYRGELIVGIKNLGSFDFDFKIGDKIAQMLIQKVERPIIEKVKNLNITSRGDSGFGSSSVENKKPILQSMGSVNDSGNSVI
jgi:dUTP pyrophosphatase